MIRAGEAYFTATVQFIVGLGLFLLVNLVFDHFIYANGIILGFNVDGLIYVFLFIIQLIGVYEVASALTKFLKGIFEVYRSFRVLRKPRLYVLLKKRWGD